MNPDFWSNTKVLVTGHTGFKGSWLSLWLENLGANLAGYALPPPTQPSMFELTRVSDGMKSVTGNVLDLEVLSGTLREHQPEIVFHMAAQSLVRRSYADPVDTYATNVMGTVNLLEAVRRTPSVRAVVVVTTDKCYENRGDECAFREADRLGGNDPYSSSKAAAELVTQAYRTSFFRSADAQHKIGIATARAGNVIGGGDWAADRLIPDVVRAVVEGKELLIRNPKAVRPWQHVLDPLCGYLTLAETLTQQPERCSQAWNFGPAESDSVPVSAVLGRLQSLWGTPFSWRQDGGPQPHEAPYLRLDCTKARAELGWEPRWNLDNALAATAQWHKAHQAGQDVRALSEEQIRSYQGLLRAPESSRR